MVVLLSIALVISFLASLNKEYKYSGSIVFSVTLICATALIISGRL